METHSTPVSRTRRSLAGLWLLSGGLVLLALAWSERDRIQMPLTALKLPAVVVTVEKKTQRVSDFDETLYAPRIRFTRPDGKEVVFVSDVWTQTVRHLEGQPIHVLFDSRTGHAIVDSRESIYGAIVLLAGSGLLLAGIGAYRLLPRSRARARMRDSGGITPT